MSYKYFGEFLVAKGAIPAKSLVGALISQISAQPPLCQIAHDQKLFSPEEFMAIFRAQQDHNFDFIAAAKALQLWTSERETRIRDELSRYRTPLGEILVKRGELDLKTLTHMLDEYLSQAKVATGPTPIPAPAPASPSALQSPAEVETEDEYPTIQEGILSELEEVFDERKYKVIKVALALVKDMSNDDQKTATKLFQDTLKISHTVNGLLKLFGVQYLGDLIAASEALIEAHLAAEASKERHRAVAELLYRAYEEAWRLRSSLIYSGSERAHMGDRENHERYQALLTELKGAYP